MGICSAGDNRTISTVNRRATDRFSREATTWVLPASVPALAPAPAPTNNCVAKRPLKAVRKASWWVEREASRSLGRARSQSMPNTPLSTKSHTRCSWRVGGGREGVERGKGVEGGGRVDRGVKS